MNDEHLDCQRNCEKFSKDSQKIMTYTEGYQEEVAMPRKLAKTLKVLTYKGALHRYARTTERTMNHFFIKLFIKYYVFYEVLTKTLISNSQCWNFCSYEVLHHSRHEELQSIF